MSKENNKFSKFIKSVIGVGAMAYAGKKILDLYTDSEDDSVISESEYKDDIEDIKNNFKNYIDIVSGDVINISDEEFFDKEKIYRSSKSDYLFKSFLENIENIIEIPDKVFKISDIEKIIPFEKMDIDEKNEYNISIMEMLSNKDDRDYIIFEKNDNLTEIFKNELSKNNADSRLWINRFQNEEFIVNPKYIKRMK